MTFRPRSGIGHTKEVRVTKIADGVDVQEWPPASVKAVAEVLRDWYVSEYETSAPVSDWYPDAFAVVNAYRVAEGQEPLK